MKLKQRQYSILVVSSQPKFNESLKGIIAQHRHFEQEILTSVSAARRRLLDRDFDIVIVNAPLSDEDGVRFAVDQVTGSSAVLLLVPNDHYEDIFERVCSQGVYMLPKPVSAQMVDQSLDWLEVTCERLKSAAKRSETLENRMNEIKLVNRAKLLLISYHGLSEEEAHRRIEKAAMDRGVKKIVIAEEIIAMNDTNDKR